ncbi:hypothetical protein BDZ45DRAFT_680630 [Acephala macrosclerotiorum]|nr:hypothetical protein BDZ45DRAFT_680630 [Acephala macrosclerotiorum]
MDGLRVFRNFILVFDCRSISLHPSLPLPSYPSPVGKGVGEPQNQTRNMESPNIPFFARNEIGGGQIRVGKKRRVDVRDHILLFLGAVTICVSVAHIAFLRFERRVFQISEDEDSGIISALV